MVLTKEQIERLYSAFDFEDYEEIVCAEEDNHKIKIHYVDNTNGVVGCYEPYLAKHFQEDCDKYNFIMNGVVAN